MIAVVDVDDLHCEEQIERYLIPLALAAPLFKVTAYTIPNKMGPVHDLKARYPWITFGIHGWEHTFCEAREWTTDKALCLLRLGLEMGYAPLFKAPNWVYDPELLPALDELGITLHHHKDQPPPSEWKGLRYAGPPGKKASHVYVHTHIERNASTDFIAEHRDFRPLALRRFDQFKTPLDFAGVV